MTTSVVIATPIGGVVAGLWTGGIALIVSAILWLAFREAYLRTGRGIRVGLAVDGFRTDPEEISVVFAAARERIRQYSSDFATVSFRIVPFAKVRSKERAREFASEYKYHQLICLKRCGDSKQPNQTYLPEIYGQDLNRLLNLDHEFAIATLRHSTAVFAIGNTGNELRSARDLAELPVRAISDAVLFVCAARCYQDEEFAAGTALLLYIDDRLKAVVAPDRYPRIQIRWLLAKSCLPLTKISMHAWPVDMERFRRELELADRVTNHLGEQYPGVALNVARTYFLLSEFQTAEKYIGIAAAGYPYGQGVDEQIDFSRAFLALIDGKYDRAARHYRNSLSKPACVAMDWTDLVLFADFAAEQGYPNAIFAQCLYRRIAGDRNGEIESRALAWINDDKSRNRLLNILQQFGKHEFIETKPVCVNPSSPVPNPKRKNRPKQRKRKQR